MTPDELPADMEREACPTCNGVRPEFCSNAFHLASPVVPAPEGEAWTARHIVFDGPPDHNGPRFIEVETPEGKSVNAGEWRQRPDNLWELVIASPVVPVGVSVDALAQEIRRVDGRHTLGAGALAEALLPFLTALRQPVVPVGVSEEQRQRVAEIVEAAIERHAPANSIRHTLDDVDAIIAALRPTDTGRE
jgi:hypothetical protein